MKLETIKIGRIVNAHGIRGEVRVQPRDLPEVPEHTAQLPGVLFPHPPPVRLRSGAPVRQARCPRREWTKADAARTSPRKKGS